MISISLALIFFLQGRGWFHPGCISLFQWGGRTVLPVLAFYLVSNSDLMPPSNTFVSTSKHWDYSKSSFCKNAFFHLNNCGCLSRLKLMHSLKMCQALLEGLVCLFFVFFFNVFDDPLLSLFGRLWA